MLKMTNTNNQVGLFTFILAILHLTHQFDYKRSCDLLNASSKLILCRNIAVIRSNDTHKLNIQLRIAAIQHPPLIILNQVNGSNKLKDYSEEIVNSLSTLFNFSQQIVIPSDQEYGNFINETWTGMMHLIATNKADIGLLITHTKERGLNVSFSPYINSRMVFILFRKLNRQNWNLFYLLKPFANDVWLCIFILTFLTSLLLVLSKINLQCKFFKLHNYHSWRPTKIKIIYHNLLLSTSRPISKRIVVQSFYIFALILYTGYNGRLTSLFAVLKNALPFRSLQQMVTESIYFPVAIQGMVFVEHFAKTNIEPWKTGWKLIKENKPYSLPIKVDDALDNVYSKQSAFITTKQEILPYITHNCSFDFAPESVTTLTESIAYSNQFPFKELFNKKILWLREMGISSALERKYFLNSYRDCDNEKFKPISLYVIIGPVAVFILGLCLSAIVLLVEKIASYLCCNTNNLTSSPLYYIFENENLSLNGQTNQLFFSRALSQSVPMSFSQSIENQSSVQTKKTVIGTPEKTALRCRSAPI